MGMWEFRPVFHDGGSLIDPFGGLHNEVFAKLHRIAGSTGSGWLAFCCSQVPQSIRHTFRSACGWLQPSELAERIPNQLGGLWIGDPHSVFRKELAK